MPSWSNAAYTSQTALANTVGGSDSTRSSELCNVGDTQKFTIDGSCVFVEIIDIDINF